MTGAVAAATSRVKVGTWVLSALHRNPGITAKAVETLDEISGWPLRLRPRLRPRRSSGARVRAARGPRLRAASKRRSRSSSRSCARAAPTSKGTFHAARDLEHRPVGPRPGRYPDHDRRQGPEDAPAGRHATQTSGAGTSRSAATSRSSGRSSSRSRRCASMSDATPRRSASPPASWSSPHQSQARPTCWRTPLRGTAEEIADGLRAFGAARLHAGRGPALAAHRGGPRCDGAGARVAGRRLNDQLARPEGFRTPDLLIRSQSL